LCRVNLPGTPAAGDRRLAIVLQEPEFAPLPTLLVVPLTDQLEALRQPGTVAVEPDASNRLDGARVALVFQLTAVDAARVTAAGGRVAREVLAEIRSALARLTGAE